MIKAIANDGLKTKLLVIRVTEEFKNFIKESRIPITKTCIDALQEEAAKFSGGKIRKMKTSRKKLIKKKTRKISGV